MKRHTCTVCGRLYRPRAAQRRPVCHRPACATELGRRKAKRKGVRRSPCASCKKPAHVGRTCNGKVVADPSVRHWRPPAGSPGSLTRAWEVHRAQVRRAARRWCDAPVIAHREAEAVMREPCGCCAPCQARELILRGEA